MTPLTALAGGALIGLSAAGLLLASGRIAGVSGILGGSFRAPRSDLAWRFAFLAGLPVGAALLALIRPGTTDFTISTNPLLLIAAGLVVGVGTQIGNGCTSGHGVCGIARGSRRSILATGVFMASGAVTVFVARHLLGAS